MKSKRSMKSKSSRPAGKKPMSHRKKSALGSVPRQLRVSHRANKSFFTGGTQL